MTSWFFNVSDHFSLSPLSGERERPRGELLMDGRPTGAVVDGAVLEATLQWPDGYLVFTTDDSPFEEPLGTTLLDETLVPVDRLWIGAPYQAGWFNDLVIDGAVRASFSFFGGPPFTVRVLADWRWRFPVSMSPIYRPFGFRTRLEISQPSQMSEA